jgi:hypothetical protein
MKDFSDISIVFSHLIRLAGRKYIKDRDLNAC